MINGKRLAIGLCWCIAGDADELETYSYEDTAHLKCVWEKAEFLLVSDSMEDQEESACRHS